MGNDPAPDRQSAADFLAGGEMGRLMRSHDWSATPLGPVARWPQSLKTAVRIVLGSRYPMFVWWGRELVNLYNDAYTPMLGQRHPAALGRRAAEVWADVWGVVGPQAEEVLREGRSTWNEELLLVMERNNFTEEAYFTFSYSPVPDDGGGVGGVFCAVTEDTGRVLGRRRLKTLRELGARTTEECRTAEQACAAAATLHDNPHDVPFALLYLLDPEGKRAALAGATRLGAGTPAGPAAVAVADPGSPWPFQKVAEAGRGQVVDLPPEQFGPLPGGAWPESPRRAVVLPLAKPGQAAPTGFLVAGLSPRLVFDDDYRGFLELAAGHVAIAVANARAYEEERKRAEALAELDRAKTAFFSNVSHEFRTPLTLMLGPVEDLLVGDRVDLPPAAIGQLQVVNRNGRRLLKLVNTLLDFSRIEAGRVQAVYEPTDLAAFTAELASVFRSAVERAGLRLMVECRALPEPVYVDRDMWEKVVLNLLSNALKFTFEGGIAVTLRPVGRAVELRVRDTGTGIPPGEMPRLFERFHQVRNARGRSHEGSGIGLALVQELVRLHGGTVRAESTVGQGTAFTVTVPLGTAHLPADRVGGSRTLVSTATGAGPFVEEALRWLPGEDRAEDVFSTDFTLRDDLLSAPEAGPAGDRSRVLVADDNADMRQYLVRLLAGRYEVEAAADGAAALEAARARAPDLVLADVMMPRLDGFGLLRELRADPRTAEVPVVLLSARAGEESRVEGLDAGADDYLVKPFSARELLARVDGHLRLARLRREAAEAQRRSERELADLFENATIGLRWVGPDGVILRANRAELDLLGYSADEYVGRHVAEFHADADVIEDMLRRLKAGEELQSYEARLRCKDGSIRHVLIDSNVLWEDGRFVHARCFTQDVTDRKQAEEVRARLAAIVESSDDAVVGKDLNGVITSWNRGAELVFGYTAHEAIGRPITMLFPPDRYDEEAVILERIRRGERVEHYETVRRRKDGRLVDVSLTVSPIVGARGRVVGASKIARDVTERKRTERALRESEERFTRFMQHLPGLAWIKDVRGRYVYANEAAERAFGRPWADLYGKTDADLFPPDTVAQFRENDRRALAARTGVQAIETLAHPDGTAHYSLVSKFPILGPDGEPVLIGGLAIDVTDHRQAESALRQSEDQLRLITDATPALISYVDAGYHYRLANRTYERWFGLSPEAIRGRHVREVLGEAAWEQVRPYMDRALAGEEVTYEQELSYRDGGGRVVQVTYTPDRGPGGEVRGFVVLVTDLTDLLRAQAETAAVNRRLIAALEGTADAFVALDRELRLTYVNRVAERLIGRPRHELLGLRSTEVFPTEQMREINERYLRVLRTGRPEHSEIFNRDVGRWIEADTYPSDDGVAVFYRDVTDRRRAEDAARAARAQLQYVADTMPAAVARCGRDGRFVWVNKEYAGRFGLTPEQLAGRSIREALGEEVFAVLAPYIERVLAGEPVDYEAEVPFPVIGRRWVHAVYAPTRDEAGAVDGWVAVVSDVTHRRQLEEALRESEARFRMLAQMAPSMVWTAAPDGTITWVNDSWYEYCRVTPEQNARGWPELVLHPDDRDRCVARWTAALAAGTEYEIEVRNRRHDGVYRWFVTRAVPARGPDGRIATWFGVTTDIHDLKELQNALEDADRRKDEFLATLAHELRNPLAPIRNAVQVFHIKEPADPQLRAARDVIDRQVRHMVRLIDDLLDVSRITRGKLHLRKQRVELAAVLQMARETADPAIQAAGHELTVELPAEPVWLDADPTRLAQVFANLLTNAAKYTDRGGRVRLRAERDGDAVAVTVTDTGIGIPAEHLPRLFETFSQVAPARERSQGGLGIGLSLVRGLVEMHGGTVSAHSPGVGRGSTFTVRLPVAPRADEEKRRGGDEETRKDESLSSSPPLLFSPSERSRVLVIDDSRDAADSLAEVLRALGCEVRVAYDGPAGLAEAARFRPDAVVCDIGMPGMSGLEVARRLRADPALRSARLVAVTGWGQDDDRRRSREAGFDRHLTKPVDPAELHRALAGGVPVGPES